MDEQSFAEGMARALVLAGARELPQASRAWIVAGGHGMFELATRERAPRTFAVDDTARMLVDASRRIDLRSLPLETIEVHCPPGMVAVKVSDGHGGSRMVCKSIQTGAWTDIIPAFALWDAVTGPSAEAQKKYLELQADWAFFETQGVRNYSELATDVTEWHAFQVFWDSGKIPSEEIGGMLNAEVVRANRVRAVLQEKATGKTVFVQDLPDRTQNIDTTHATPLLPFAEAVDELCKKSPFCDALTNPSDRARGIKLPGFPKLPGGILGGIAIIGGSILVANAVIQAAVRKAFGA